MSSYRMLDVRVIEIETVTAQVKRFTLEDPTQRPLPTFSGGSHIIVQMQQGEQCYRNAYSLLSSPFDLHRYQIAVRRESPSKGGSDFMHDRVKIGDTLTISTPNNLFALAPTAEQHLLIAGGIGITPFLAQLHELHQRGQRYRLHYCFHSEEHNAFQTQLQASPFAEHVRYHISSQGGRLDVTRLLAEAEPDAHIYVCGPSALNDAVLQAAAALGIAPTRVHREAFAAANSQGGAFTLVLARSGIELEVAPNMTILQALENSKAAKVECLCREGICGTCETRILEGEADHRDQYLSEEEREAQQSLLICCSRARGPRLVLDL
ncbi:PDR/VanB family oxidoreductase [Serratia liquefaciens]|uniref:PDR/VanB family oxidoreductase n=1 Tax=Serratia liquefaciens TaxID=614 RepID=UPI0022DDB28B|nr:PDR/VanB family oxidoreductase [Serratia liquefaciens]WBL74447.1 PDR/VanB family oxidoreductase [Serratia liquefaciens]